MNAVFEKLEHRLVVSCQAEGSDPFNSPEGVTLFARAVIMGGAAGIRSRDIDKTKMITESVDVPVIGLTKGEFADGSVRITRTMKEIDDLVATGCNILAVDGTFREWDGMTGPEFIREVKSKYTCLIMADISTLKDGLACEEAGADCLSTTLSGYTPETADRKKRCPDFTLIRKLCRKAKIPVFAEGRISSPAHVAKAMKLGAFACVVGTIITRPRLVTRDYVRALGE